MFAIIRYLLFPITLLYALGVRVRHFLYDKGVFRSQAYATPTICVGNIRVGGTGKSPMTEYLIRLLSRNYRVGVLSRGYGRKTKGLVMATPKSVAEEIGDEPCQIYNKFPCITLVVDGNRCRAMEVIEMMENPPEVVVLDDAMQHRRIKPGLGIVLTAYGQLYVDDWLLPVGNLRDEISRVTKANVIVVTKCPNVISENEKNDIRKKLQKSSSLPIFFTRISYSEKVFSQREQQSLEEFIQQPFVLVTGIANAKPLVDFLKENNAVFEHWSYADHHHFSSSEIEKIRQKKRVLTTEKDFVRLKNQVPEIYYIPIQMVFISKKEEEEFHKMITKYVDESRKL